MRRPKQLVLGRCETILHKHPWKWENRFIIPTVQTNWHHQHLNVQMDPQIQLNERHEKRQRSCKMLTSECSWWLMFICSLHAFACWFLCAMIFIGNRIFNCSLLFLCHGERAHTLSLSLLIWKCVFHSWNRVPMVRGARLITAFICHLPTNQL